MKLIKFSIIFTGLFLTLIGNVSASEETGGFAGSVLNWGVGARAIALGNAYSPIAEDGTAIYWNPAGLGSLENKSVAVMHSFVFEDRTQNFAAFSMPVSKFGIGAAWFRFGVNDIQERDQTGQLVGHFDDSENIFIIGSGTRILSGKERGLNIGASFKYYYQSLYEYSATGWGLDIGSMFSLKDISTLSYLKFVFVVQNIGSKLKWNTDSNHEDDIPLCLNIGAAASLSSSPLLFTITLDKIEGQSLKYHLGSEFIIHDILPVRLGLNDSELSAGIGYIMDFAGSEIHIDYAYTDDEISNRGLHYISLELGF